MSFVSFDNGTFPLEDVQENPVRYVKRLERAKITPGFAICMCVTHPTPLQLVIRRYGSLLHLAGWPGDGHRHSADCVFHKNADARKLAGDGDSTAAIIDSPAGLNVRLDASLSVREAQTGSRGTAAGTRSGTSRRSATLLAFLQTLWSQAGLNQWTGRSATRHWGACNALLLAEAGTALINGTEAQKVLHIMRRYDQADRAAINAEFDTFIGGLVSTRGTTQRGLVIGEVNEVATTPYGHSLSLRQSARKYYASSTLIEHVAKTHSHAWRAIGERTARVVSIVLVERTSKGHLKLVDLAVMLCSSTFVPCDSIHEVAMANRLVSEHRDFEKPMRLAVGDDMLPDFILRDMGAETHIEIYGMNGVASYEARKQQKSALRQTRRISCVEWNVDREALDEIRLPLPAAGRTAT